jgi:hypothetical protein
MATNLPKENWLADGNETPIQEGFLVGDRKGLETLRAAIDRALADGEGDIRELRSPWSHVHLAAQHPEEEQSQHDRSLKGKIGKYVALTVVGLAFFFGIYGCAHFLGAVR